MIYNNKFFINCIILFIMLLCVYNSASHSRENKIKWNKKTIIKPSFKERSSLVNYIYRNISFKIYVRDNDYISNEIKTKHFWKDCSSIYNIWDYYNLWKYNYFIDVGANIGSCTVLMLHNHIQVISFEPIKNNLNLLSKSLLYYRKYLHNITLYMVGLSNKSLNETIFIDFKNWGGSSLFRKTKYSEIINLFKLDDITININNKIGMMKIDIECSELNMVEGSINFITQHFIKVIYFEQFCNCYKNITTANVIYSILESLGYNILNKLNCSIEKSKNVIAIRY